MNSEQEGRPILYPAIPSLETNTINIKQLSDARVNEMMNKKKELEKELRHYVKVRKHWTRLDSCIKIIGTFAAVTASLGATVTATISGVPFIVPAILAGIAAVDGALTEIVVVGWTSRKKKIFRERCELIQSYMDKMYIYTEKCKQDGIISIEELEGNRKLIEEYNNAIRVEKSIKNRKEYDYEKMEREVHREVNKDLKKELISELK